MAKVNGLQGVISGKLGNTVFRNRYGKTIAAQYQPNVENRRTETQVAQREKFKLLNQLAAVLAASISIPRVGSRTGRNTFVSLNQRNIVDVPNSEFVGIDALKIQLTDAQPALTALSASPHQAGNYSTLDIEATGAHLAVATRPERRTAVTRQLYVIALAIPTGSSDMHKILIGGTKLFTDANPSKDLGDYTGEMVCTGFDDLDTNHYHPIILGYEIAVTTEAANRQYGNIGGDEVTNQPYIVLSSMASANYANTMFSATSGYDIMND